MPRELLTMTGAYTQFEGANIVAENCTGAKVRDLVINGKTYQNLFNAELSQGHVYDSVMSQNKRVNSGGFTLDSTTYTMCVPSGYEVLIYKNFESSNSVYIGWANKIVWTNSATTNNIRIMIRKANDEELTVDEVIGKVILLKGNYTNIDLPTSIDGIESVAEVDKNLVNTATIYEGMAGSGGVGSLFNPTSNSTYDAYKIEIQPNTEYLFNLVGYGQSPYVRILDKNNMVVKAQSLSVTELSYIWSLQTEDNYYYLVFNKPKTSTGTFQVYKKENPYTLKLAVNEEINFINLPFPLRSLPNGVCDTIEGNTLVQRVGKVVLDGSDTTSFTYTLDTQNSMITTARFYIIVSSSIFNCVDSAIDRNDIFMANFPLRNGAHGDYEYMAVQVMRVSEVYKIFLSINRAKLESVGVGGLKKWLSENPVTIYYPLATPITHNITVPQLRTIRGTNVVTTYNNIKPVISCKLRLSKARVTS